MQTMVCFFLLFTVSVAEYGDVYVYNDYKNYKNENGATEHKERGELFKFDYHSEDMLKMGVVFKNKPENVLVDVYLRCNNAREKKFEKNKASKTEEYFEITRHLKKTNNITIELELFTNTSTNQKSICTTKKIVEAALTQTPNGPKYYDICLNSDPCVVEVDLSTNMCEVPNEPTKNPFASIGGVNPSEGDIKTTGYDTSTETNMNNKAQNNVLTFVITGLIVMSIIILVVCISVKKYCQRNSQPEGIMELNTYATTNEVVYAHLSLAQGNSQPPRRGDESPYAKIIGVMRPVPS